MRDRLPCLIQASPCIGGLSPKAAKKKTDMIPTTHPSDADMARLSAQMLLDIEAVHLNTTQPFTLSSGAKAPTYIDCRKLISFPADSRNADGFSNRQNPAQCGV